MEKKHRSEIYQRGRAKSSSSETVQSSPDSQIKWELEKMTRLEQGLSNVVATAADYEADRASEQRRLEQRLQDLEESFNNLEVPSQEQQTQQLPTVSPPTPQNTQTDIPSPFLSPQTPLPSPVQVPNLSPHAYASMSPYCSSSIQSPTSVDPGYQQSPPLQQSPQLSQPVAPQNGPHIQVPQQSLPDTQHAFTPQVSPHISQPILQTSQFCPVSLSQAISTSSVPQTQPVLQPIPQSTLTQPPFQSRYIPYGISNKSSVLKLDGAQSATTTPFPTQTKMQVDSRQHQLGMLPSLSVSLGKTQNTGQYSSSIQGHFGFGQPVMGTMAKFIPPSGQDTIVMNETEQYIDTRHQCISAMKEYENKSLEELRVEDYLAGRKRKEGFAHHSFSKLLTLQSPSGFTIGCTQNRGFGVSVFPTSQQKSSSKTGTTVKFVPLKGQDTMVKTGVTQHVNTEYQCITAMKEYENWSLEELRVEDYLANRKVPSSKLYCDKCISMQVPTDLIQCCEGHLLCSSCVKLAAKTVVAGRVSCPLSDCDSVIPRSQVRKIAPEMLYTLRDENWENKWIAKEESKESSSGAYVAMSMDKTEPEFQTVSSLFYHTMYHKNHSYCIKKVYRIQNPRLWEKYNLTRTHMLEDLGKMLINERRLFHGTSVDVVPDICEEGFDWRLCGKNATRYGKGAYFAKDATYSHEYVTTSRKSISLNPEISISSNTYLMFVVKVLVGRIFLGDSSTARPPKVKSGSKTEQVHTAVNLTGDPSIFVVFDISQSYPEYLIEYRKDS